MAASGLQESIYASNTVVHMPTGKAIAWAVRAHFIVDAALNALLLSCALDVLVFSSNQEPVEFTETTCESFGHGKAVLDEAARLYDQLMQGLVSAEQVCQNSAMAKVSDVLFL